jgi:hypothetical protein
MLPDMSDGWALGYYSTILRWNGSQWTAMPHKFTGKLNAIAVVQPDDIWATGIGQLAHWDGNDWTPVTSPAREWINGIAMLSPSEGWAVGDHGVIMSWNGVQWTRVSAYSPFDVYISVYALNSADAWIAGGHKTLHWDGSAWTQVPLPRSNMWLNSVAMALQRTAGPWRGWRISTDGSGWTETSGPTTEWVNAVAMASATDGWAVGSDGTILHWDGSTWTPAPSPTTENLTSVTMRSAGDGWIAGDHGTVLRWDGSAWTRMPTPTENYLFGIAPTGPAEAWAVGENGAILRYDGRLTPLAGVTH